METMDSKQIGLFISFSLGKELFAVDVHQSRKVLSLSESAMNPELTSLLLGTITFENEEIPLVNLYSKLGIEKSEKSSKACIIVVEIPVDDNVLLLGVLADSLEGVARFDSDYFELLDKLQDSSNLGKIEALDIIKKRMITILDIKRIFSAEELEDIVITSTDSLIH